MCFSQNQSFLNTAILIICSVYLFKQWRLSIFLIFLSIKDLIQGFLYYYQNNEKMEHFLSILSWIHICFQPLFVNIFISHFTRTKNNYWNIIFILCFIYGLYTLTTLNEFDIQNDINCITNNENDDFCSNTTTSYIGKYHIAYKFSRDKDILFFPIIYLILMFIPSLLTSAKIIGVLWIIFVSIIYIYYNNINHGEKAAIWCFLSIIFFLPLSIFNKNIIKYLEKD